MESFLAQILLVGFNFAPQGYAFCNGQLMAINQNTALFSLMGTFYGGDGITTFALPNLQGRVPIHQGNGAGLSPYTQGQVGGVEAITILQQNLPAHSHSFNVNSKSGTVAGPTTVTYLSAGPSTGSGPNATLEKIYTTTAPDTVLPAGTIGQTGGGQPVPIIQPYLVLNYVIALTGIFPSRS